MPNVSAKAPRPAPQDATSPAPAAMQPRAVFRYGSVSAAVFTDTVTKDGKSLTRTSVSLRRSYRNAEGAWQHTHSLRPGDLLSAALALTRCFESIEAADDEEAESR